MPLIAEDLGVITPEVEALRDEFDLPGMRVIQFGFDADPASEKHLPHRYINNCIAYTGTHDNDTTYGWYHSTEVTTTQPREEVEAARAFAREYANIRRAGDPLGPDPHAVRLGGRHGDRADAGHPRAGQPRPDELPRQGRRGTGPGGTAPSRSTGGSRDRLAELTALYGRWNGPIPADARPAVSAAGDARACEPDRIAVGRSPAARRGTQAGQTAP